MKQSRLLKTSLFFGLMFCISLAQAAPLAMLTGVRGPVNILRGGKSVPAKTGAALQSGDVVRAGAGGAATIYFASRAPQTLGANQQVKIGADGSASAPSLWSSVYQGVAAGFARRGEKIGATVRPGFASDQIAPLSPVNSLVLATPTLFWALENPPQGGDFQVTIRDAAGNDLLQIATPQTKLSVPLPLQSGPRYLWQVTPRERDAAGKLVPLSEKSSAPAWFQIAPPAVQSAAKREGTQIAAALLKAPENTRRAAQAAALAGRKLWAEAIAVLTRRTLENEAPKGAAAALRKHDALVASLPDAARWQLRRLYIETQQTELASRIAPELLPAPAVRGGPQTPPEAAQTPVEFQNATDYADPGGAFALRVPQGWKSTRAILDNGQAMTQFSSGGPADPQITIIARDDVAGQSLETLPQFGGAWINEIIEALKKTGEVLANPQRQTRFLDREVLFDEVRYYSQATGHQRGYLAVVLGQKSALLLGLSAASDKPLELVKLEAVLASLAVESKTPLPPAKIAKRQNKLWLGVELNGLEKLPPDMREALVASEGLIRVQDEILNPPTGALDADGKPLSPAAAKTAFEVQNAEFAALPDSSLERWRAARELAALAGRLGWAAYDEKNAALSTLWFTRRDELEKIGNEAAREHFEAQFAQTQKQVEGIQKRVPLESKSSDERLLLGFLHHLQGMRAASLENLSRDGSDPQGVEKWAQIQLNLYRLAHEYKKIDVQNGTYTADFLLQDTLNIANALDSLAEAQTDLGRFEEVEKTYRQSLELRRSLPADYVSRYADIPLRRLGNFYKTLGDHRLARDYYEQAWQEVEASMPARQKKREAAEPEGYRDLMLVETVQTRTVLLNNLSLTISTLGDFKTAEKQLRQALGELDALPKTARAIGVVTYQRAVTLGNLAVLRADSGDLAGAFADFEESIHLWRAGGYAAQAGNALLNTAGLYQQMGRLDEQKGRLAQARQFFASAHDVAGLIGANLLGALAAREAEKWDEAATRATEALTLARQSGSADWIGAGARSLAAVRIRQNRLGDAETLLQEAARTDERTQAPLDIAMTLRWQGELLEKRQQPAQALEKYGRAIEQIEGVRATAQSQSAFSDNKHIYSIYENIVLLLIKMGRATEAFDYLGRAKSKQLQDSLRVANFKSGDVTMQARLDRVAGLAGKIGAFESALQSERAKTGAAQSREKIEALQTRLSDSQSELKAITAQIAAAKPQLLGDAAAPSLQSVQKQIPADAVLVQWAPLGEQLFAFVVTQNAIKAQPLPVPASEVWARIREFRALMDTARRNAAAGQNIAVKNWLSADKAVAPLRENLLALRKMLLEPIETQIAGKETVVFVPNRLIYYLPLHALAKQSGNTISFLGQEKNVAYLAAADVLSVLQNAPQRGNGLMALGNPAGAALPGAGDEARALGRIFADAQVFTGAQATKNAVLTPQNEKRGIWHFATHGMLNSAAPDQSYILLAPGGREGDERLTIGEVYGLDLHNTDLVTLSACQTALGERNPDGVEITSLATSFARAGAGSVVASLWSVADDSTREFMVEFYSRLAAGSSKTAALSRAQAKLINNPRFNHPYYWAPFVLMGDWR